MQNPRQLTFNAPPTLDVKVTAVSDDEPIPPPTISAWNLFR